MICDYCELEIDDYKEFCCRCGVQLCEDCWFVTHENECSFALEEGPLA